MAGTWIKMVSEGQVERVLEGVLDAVAVSFKSNPMRNRTKREETRRTHICFGIFERLRGDLHWSVSKIFDMLPIYLKCELDGVPYNPDDVGDSWAPEGVEAALDVPKTPETAIVDGAVSDAPNGADERDTLTAS